MKQPILKLTTRSWSKVNKSDQKKIIKWLKSIVKILESGDPLTDDFYATYP